MTSRRPLPLVLATLIAASSLVGCVPESPSEPSPPPAFASEKEAFAAAEETYRAYIDVVNAVDLTDPVTFEPVFDLLTDSALAAAKKSFSELHAGRVVMTGTSQFDSFHGDSYKPGLGRITAGVCFDVSNVQLTDAEGGSLVTEDRPDRQPMQIQWQQQERGGELLITSMRASESRECER